jgi:hypothetical protein
MKKSTNNRAKNKSRKWSSFSAMRTLKNLGYSGAVSLRHIIICRSVAWWPKWRRILGCRNSSAWAAWSPAAPAPTRSAQHALVTCLGCLATRRYQNKICSPARARMVKKCYPCHCFFYLLIGGARILLMFCLPTLPRPVVFLSSDLGRRFRGQNRRFRPSEEGYRNNFL